MVDLRAKGSEGTWKDVKADRDGNLLTAPVRQTEVLWTRRASSNTKALSNELANYATKIFQFVCTGFSGTIDIQGRVNSQATYQNVASIQMAQDGPQNLLNNQISFTTATANYFYYVPEYYPEMQVVMTRTAGDISGSVVALPSALDIPMATAIVTGANSLDSDVFDGGTLATTLRGLLTLALAHGYDGTITRPINIGLLNDATFDGSAVYGPDTRSLLYVRKSPTVNTVLYCSSVAADADGGDESAQVTLKDWNGTNYDRRRNNINVTLLASAERTVATSSADQTNYNAKGVIVTFDVTAVSGTPSLTLAIEHKDSVSATYEKLLDAPAVTAAGTHSYIVYPGANTTAREDIVEASGWPIGRTWRISVAVGSADACTYSVGASYIL